MGCSWVNKHSREIFVKSDNMIKAIEEIKVNPSLFIQENESKIKQIYRFGPIISFKDYEETRLCFHREANIKRIVKILKKDQIKSETIRTSYEREIEILKYIDHPNIIKVIEYFIEINRMYVVMEYCEGGQLVSEIVKRGSLSESEVALIMKQVFSAVHLIHRYQIIHRNLTLENLLLESPGDLGSIKLVDFTKAIPSTGGRKSEITGNYYYISPEMINKSYSELSDLWSCGVILYTLLNGDPPFTGISNEILFESIKKGNYNIEDNQWDFISVEAKNLIKYLLCKERKRISAAQALNHKWINRSSEFREVPREYEEQILKSLLSFHAPNKIKLAVRTFLTTIYISNEDTKELKQLFSNWDVNGDGKLSAKELEEAYREILPEEEAEEKAEKIIEALDADQNGYIDYEEFIESTVDFDKLTSVGNLEKAFAVFDYNWNGTIEASELRRVLDGGVESDDRIWRDLLKEVDQDYNGVIDFREFFDLIKSQWS